MHDVAHIGSRETAKVTRKSDKGKEDEGTDDKKSRKDKDSDKKKSSSVFLTPSTLVAAGSLASFGVGCVQERAQCWTIVISRACIVSVHVAVYLNISCEP